MAGGARTQEQGIGGVSSRPAAWVAWSSMGVAVALAALGLLLEYANGTSWVIEHVSFALPFVAFATVATVGALVASRREALPLR